MVWDNHSPSAAAAPPRSPLYGVQIPAGYRNWALIAPSHEAGQLDELRGILGNPLALRAFRSGLLPFPDGAIVAKVAWKQVPLAAMPGGFVPGRATTVQFMVKDSKRYASSGGWGFGRFVDGKPVDEAQHRTCFGCHDAHERDHDFLFTRYAP